MTKENCSEVIKYIMENVSLIKTIEDYGLKPIKESEGRYTMLCPFHSEDTASLKIYDNKSFFCFGCSSGYSVIDFIQMYENISFMDVINRYKNKTQGPTPEDIYHKILNQKNEQTIDLAQYMYSSKFRLGITLREILKKDPLRKEFVDRCFYDMDNFFENVDNLNKDKIDYFEDSILERISDEI